MEPGLKESGGEAIRAVLRPMRDEDLPDVWEIDSRSLARPWTRDIWRQELRSPFSRYTVAESEGAVAGYIGLKHTADELHIVNTAVRPESRRGGLARRLLRAALTEHPDALKVHLEVRPSNTPARALYESMGFSVVGRRPGYYGDEDALLMSLSL